MTVSDYMYSTGGRGGWKPWNLIAPTYVNFNLLQSPNSLENGKNFSLCQNGELTTMVFHHSTSYAIEAKHRQAGRLWIVTKGQF
jgi:hypothetical protein